MAEAPAGPKGNKARMGQQKVKPLLMLLSLILLAGAMPVAASTPTEDLLNTDRALAAQSLKVGFVKAYGSAIGAGARKLDPGAQPVIGRESVLAYMAKYPTGDEFRWTPAEAVVAKSGELGFTWGRWVDTYRVKHGKLVKAYGKYLDVWRLDSDGKWRWIADMGNSNPPPTLPRT
jgi:hypothetical protein